MVNIAHTWWESRWWDIYERGLEVLLSSLGTLDFIERLRWKSLPYNRENVITWLLDSGFDTEHISTICDGFEKQKIQDPNMWQLHSYFLLQIKTPSPIGEYIRWVLQNVSNVLWSISDTWKTVVSHTLQNMPSPWKWWLIALALAGGFGFAPISDRMVGSADQIIAALDFDASFNEWKQFTKRSTVRDTNNSVSDTFNLWAVQKPITDLRNAFHKVDSQEVGCDSPESLQSCNQSMKEVKDVVNQYADITINSLSQIQDPVKAQDAAIVIENITKIQSELNASFITVNTVDDLKKLDMFRKLPLILLCFFLLASVLLRKNSSQEKDDKDTKNILSTIFALFDQFNRQKDTQQKSLYDSNRVIDKQVSDPNAKQEVMWAGKINYNNKVHKVFKLPWTGKEETICPIDDLGQPLLTEQLYRWEALVDIDLNSSLEFSWNIYVRAKKSWEVILVSLDGKTKLFETVGLKRIDINDTQIMWITDKHLTVKVETQHGETYAPLKDFS